MSTAQQNTKSITSMIPDIEGTWREYKRKKIKQYPQNNLRASSAGFPCDRYHFHSVHDWRERTLHDEILQSIFDEGNDHEKLVMRDLVAMGFEVVEQQRAFQMDKPLITGKIDGILRWQDNDFPFDVKTINPYDFAKIQSIEDLMYSKKMHQRNYPAQLQLYLLMTGNDVGCLLFKNKLTGEIKTIWAQIDYAYADNILKRAERVYAALKENKPPERINDFDTCKDCYFKHICLPDLKMGEGVIPIDDMELASLLERREQLEAQAKEYKQIDKDVKDAVTKGGVGEKICGDFIIRVTEHDRKTKVPITWTDKVTQYFRTQILKLEAQA